MAKDQYPLGDYLKSINETKEDLTLRDPEWMKKYPPFIINRCLSSHMDAILMANEMNFHHQLDKDLQYSFYLNTLRKRKRFSPWQRKDKIEDLDVIKQYFHYNDDKAKDALRILTKDQIELIKSKLK